LKSEPSAAESVATARQVSPQKLATVIRGELDWITLKALEKDRDRRYATVNGLLADVTRYLNGEAVHAAPPSRIYLIRKTARRHRAAVVATIAIAHCRYCNPPMQGRSDSMAKRISRRSTR
jgi:hypothetical protein